MILVLLTHLYELCLVLIVGLDTNLLIRKLSRGEDRSNT